MDTVSFAHLFCLGSGYVLWTELCPSQNSYIEALIPDIMVFEEKAFREILRTNGDIRADVLSRRGRNTRNISFHAYTEKRSCEGTEKAAIYKTGRELSPETKIASTLM